LRRENDNLNPFLSRASRLKSLNIVNLNMSTKLRKKRIHKKIEEAFRFYESRGYRGHVLHPEIIEESKKHGERLVEDANFFKWKGYRRLASIASFLTCEDHACPITLRMARDNSPTKIKTKDLHLARQITGVKPKLNPINWVDGVVRTLKSRGIVPQGDEERIKKQMIEEIPKIRKEHIPRYMAILAAHRVLGNVGYSVGLDEMKDIFNVSTTTLRKYME